MEQDKYKRVPLQKNKRRMTKTRTLKKIGVLSSGKIYYPTSVKSLRIPLKTTILHGFQLQTSYLSNLSQNKLPIHLKVFVEYDTNNLMETIIVEVPDVCIYLSQEDFTQIDSHKSVSKTPEKQVHRPRKLIVPNRITLDRYNLSICLFQRDNYLAIPICLSDRGKEHISEGWLYGYNTVINGVEGLYFEASSDTPIQFRGQISLV